VGHRVGFDKARTIDLPVLGAHRDLAAQQRARARAATAAGSEPGATSLLTAHLGSMIW
jgi:hypothetical protein